MNEEEKRRLRCCLAGPGPRELKRPVDDIRVDLENAILEAVRQGYTTFLSGMCPGVDIWGAEIVIRLKDRFPALRLVAVIPCPGFGAEWPEEWRARYNRLLSLAEYVKVLDETNDPAARQARDEWMVRHSSLVLAVYGDPSGRPCHVLRQALQLRVPVRRMPA